MFHLKLLINFLSLSIVGQIDWHAFGNSQDRLVLRWSQADLQPCSIKQILRACCVPGASTHFCADNYKVVDCIEIYNFNIKFVFIWLYLKRLWIYLYCSMVITAISYNKLVVKISSLLVHMVRRQRWGAHHHCWLVVQTGCDDGPSPSVGKTKRQW